MEKVTIEPALFTRFNDFPFEIRNMIWREALPDPRIIQLDFQLLKIQDYSTKSMGCRQLSPEIPSVLLVCLESYEIALQFYTQALLSAGSPGTSWIDFERDTILFDGQTLTSISKDLKLLEYLGDDAHLIQNLVIGGVEGPWMVYEETCWAIICYLGKLKEVVLSGGEQEDVRGKNDELAFIDSMVRYKVLDYFNEKYSPMGEKHWEVHKRVSKRMTAGAIDYAMQRFREWEEEMKEMGMLEDKIFERPVFAKKIILTRGEWEAVQEAKRKYEKEREDYRLLITIKLQAVGMESVLFQATRDTTPTEICEAVRRQRSFSPDTELELYSTVEGVLGAKTNICEIAEASGFIFELIVKK